MSRNALTDRRKNIVDLAIIIYGSVCVLFSGVSVLIFDFYQAGMAATVVYAGFETQRVQVAKNPPSQGLSRRRMSYLIKGGMIACAALLLYGVLVDGAANRLILAVCGFLYMIIGCCFFYGSIMMEPQKERELTAKGRSPHGHREADGHGCLSFTGLLLYIRFLNCIFLML